MKPGQALQVFLDATARANDGPSERGWLLMSATKTESGGFKMAVTGHQQTGPFLRLPDTMDATDPELPALLSGRRAHLIFNGLGALNEGVSVTVEVSLYLVDGADAERPPVNPANPLARETFSRERAARRFYRRRRLRQGLRPGARQPGHGPERRGAAPDLRRARLAGAAAGRPDRDPEGAHPGRGPDLLLEGQRPHGGAARRHRDDSIHTITPTQTGVYQVAVIVTRGAAQSRFLWDVLVDAADSKEMNTPPEVKIASTAAVVRVGDPVPVWLQAVGRDREQGVLSFSWQASDPSVLAAISGPRVPFLAVAPGDYKISCVASDGMADSVPATLVITVVAANTNRPPEAPAVTPLSAMVTSARSTGPAR